MKNLYIYISILIASLTFADVFPKIGYLYPAGGQRGTTFRIIAGGQKLRKPTGVFISGKGVHGKIIGFYKLRRNLNREQRILLKRKLEKVRDAQIAKLPEKLKNKIHFRTNIKQNEKDDEYLAMMRSKTNDNPKVLKKLLSQEKIPDNPLLHNLENKNLRELANIAEHYMNRQWRRQWNQQLSELVEIEISIDNNASLGSHEFRLITEHGMSNPMVFQVDTLPEKKELEPNNISANQKLPRMRQLPIKFLDQTVDLPIIFNGQIMPGDVDKFRFRAKKGQKIIIEIFARKLIPYLAEAVPGWFQPVITLFNSQGKKLAFKDDYRFNPDPVLYYTIPRNGEYEIEIRDAIFRGRSDFVYRIKISNEPFVTDAFPLGGRKGHKTAIAISGYNLPETNIYLETKPYDKSIRQTFYREKNYKSNPIVFSVDNLPECLEKENNNSTNEAQKIHLPIIINGKIQSPGDIDIFNFHAKKNEKIVAEVLARQLNSPLNSLLKIYDCNGKLLAWNDDYIVKDKFLHISKTGLITHHADSYLSFIAPKNGEYFVRLSDSLNHGGKAYAYRLRLSHPRPDFVVFSSPSTLNLFPGATAVFTVYVVRKEGFNGPIRIFTKNKNLKISGGIIPAETNKINMTITLKNKKADKIINLNLFAKAKFKNKHIIHKVIPTDNTMQAFLYRQLVPAKKMIIYSKGVKWKIPPVILTNQTPVKITCGKETKLYFKINRNPKFLRKLKVELDSPSQGINITDTRIIGSAICICLHAEKLNPGYKNNLIFTVSRERFIKNKKRTFKIDTLPAVPFVIVK